MNNPKLRFRDDSGSRFVDWQKVSFGKTFSFLKSSAFSRAQLNYRDGQIKNVHYGDILVKFPTILNSCCNDVPYVNPAEKTEKYDLLQVGDIVIADTAEDLTVGKAIEISDVSNSIIAGLHTIACRPQRKFANRFLGYYLNSKAFHNQLVPLATGIKVYSIIKSEIVKTRINVPCLEEQQKIAAFFSTLDEKIELSERKLEALEQLKKGLMQKIFNQGVRFKPSHNNEFPPWQTFKLSEISEIRTGPFGSVLHASDYVKDGIPIVTTEHFKFGLLPNEKTGIPQVSDSDFARLNSYTLRKGDLVFSRVGSVDINALVESTQNGWLFSGRVLRVRPISTVSSRFLHYVLDTENVKRNIVSRAVGLTMASINTAILGETKVILPCIEEQKRIASFFYLM